MQYALLIYVNENGPKNTPEQDQALFSAYMNFEQTVSQKGIKKAGEALHPTSSASTVRIRNGKTTTTDGPFAETKEQLGGFYLLECKDLDEAIEWATKVPDVKNGSIEIRP